MGQPKVLYISYNAASESVTQSQVIPYVEELSKRGIKISLVTYEKKLTKDLVKFNQALRERLSRLGIVWYCLRYHKSPTLPATVYDILQGTIFTYFLVLKHKYNIIHARQIVPATICMTLRKILKFKWLFDMRGFVAEEYVGHGAWREGGVKFRLVKFIEKLCLSSANSITVLTHKQKDFMLNSGFLRNKKNSIEVIPCCVDLKRFILNSEKNQEIINRLGLQQKFILIYLGSLGTCYLLGEMIDFFLLLKQSIKNAYFLFVTHGSKELIISKARERGLNDDSFKIIGYPFQSIPDVLSIGDAGIYFINPYKKLGSCPIKLGEYLGCGLPVVINSGIGDSEEIVKREEVGVVINEFSDKMYQRATEELRNFSVENQGLRQRCRDTAEKLLSLDKGAEGYKDIYNRLSR